MSSCSDYILSICKYLLILPVVINCTDHHTNSAVFIFSITLPICECGIILSVVLSCIVHRNWAVLIIFSLNYSICNCRLILFVVVSCTAQIKSLIVICKFRIILSVVVSWTVHVMWATMIIFLIILPIYICQLISSVVMTCTICHKLINICHLYMWTILINKRNQGQASLTKCTCWIPGFHLEIMQSDLTQGSFEPKSAEIHSKRPCFYSNNCK